MSIPALRKLLFVHRPTTYNVRHSFPNNGCRSKTHTIASHHFYSTRISFENGANINKAIDALDAVLADCDVGSIELPQQGLNRDLIRRLLQSVAKRWTILSACGAANPRAERNPIVETKVFHKPNFEALKKIQSELIAGRLWSYQMQNIPLDEESVAKLTDHIFEICDDQNCIELTLDPKAEVLRRPPIDPLTSQPDLSDRTFTIPNPELWITLRALSRR